MKYSWSAETSQDVAERVRTTGLLVEDLISRRLETGELQAIDLSLRYVPVVMAPEFRDRYPARTKLRKNQRLLDCAPQLNYDQFLRDERSALAEWTGGLRGCLHLLAKLPLDPSEIANIDAFLLSILSELEDKSSN